MTYRDQMLAAMRGEGLSRVPWAPRMDLWQISLQARGTLPARFAGKNTAQIADELGVACHAVRADQTMPRAPGDVMLRGLGIDNHPDYPYRVELRGLEAELDVSDGHTRCVVHAPAGRVETDLMMTQQMKAEGISLSFVHRYPVQSVADLDAVAQVLEHCEVVPTPHAYQAFRDRIGERGVAVASGPISASPMHLLLHELMSMEDFFYLYADDPAALLAFAERVEPFYQACLDAVVASDAIVVAWGGNYDRDLTWPPFFEAHIALWLRRVADGLHDAGKMLQTHADGENDGLLHFYEACGVDVIESVCPAPMTSLTLRQLRAGVGDRVTIWGGVPSVALLPDAMDGDTFDRYLDDLLTEVADTQRLILGVSDNVPPDADMERLRRLRDRLAGS